MAFRIILWVVALALAVISLVSIATIGWILAPFAAAALLAAFLIDRRADDSIFVGRLFATIVLALGALGAGANAVAEYRSNECVAGLPYECGDSHSEIVLAVIALACVVGAVSMAANWMRAVTANA